MNLPNTPTVSVIIATYNKRKTLRYAIDSVLWQTFQDFECWVVGDACTDGSGDLVEGYGDPRLKWHNLEHNSGYQSAPNNEGLRRARGKYIAYLNHDDIWLPNHLQILLDCITRNNADFAYSIMEWITDEYKIADIPNFPEALRPPESPATMHTKDVIRQIGYWKSPEEIRADPRVAFFRDAQFSGLKFAFAPHLTTLKFGKSPDGYSEASHQEEYMQKISQDPDFLQKELSTLLAEAYFQLEGPLSFKRLRTHLGHSIRRLFIKGRIDPGSIYFWRQRGQRIKNWRKGHGLDPS